MTPPQWQRDLHPTVRGSDLRFPDGAAYRVEIPSVETPAALRAVLEASDELGVPVHRVSQGSGMMMLRDEEIAEMVALGREHDVEVCLFTGPRASWDTGIQASTLGGSVAAGVLRGDDQIRFSVRDLERGCALGVRSVLISDLGLVKVVAELKQAGDLPSDLVIKVSASLPVANGPTAALLEQIGASTLNVMVDLTIADLAGIRSATSLPLDMYVEAPDGFGGSIRYYEMPEMVRVAAPIYLKFAVRNSPGLYPWGQHLHELSLATARERVRRASLALRLLQDVPS